MCEDAQFDFLFLADAWGWSELDGRAPGHLLDRVARPAAAGPGGRGRGADPVHAATRSGHHRLDAARAAVRVGPPDGQPGSPLRGATRLEHRDHRDGGHGGAGVRRADGGPRRALRDGRRLHGARLQAVGGRVGTGRAGEGQGRPLRRPGEGPPHRPRRSVLPLARLRQHVVLAAGHAGAVPGGLVARRPCLRRHATPRPRSSAAASAAVQAEQTTGDPGRGGAGRTPPRRREGDVVVRLRRRAARARRRWTSTTRSSPRRTRRSPSRRTPCSPGLDLSSYAPDTPMTELRTELSQTQVTRFAGQTVGQVLRDWAAHGVGAAPFVGSADEVADHICSLAEEADLDGFLLHPAGAAVVDDRLHRARAADPARTWRGAGRRPSATLRERLLGADRSAAAADHPGAASRRWRSIRHGEVAPDVQSSGEGDACTFRRQGTPATVTSFSRTRCWVTGRSISSSSRRGRRTWSSGGTCMGRAVGCAVWRRSAG